MKKIICKNYTEMSLTAAKIIAKQIKTKPNSILGLATGSTPIGTYEQLQKMYKKGTIDFAKTTTFNLDEYYPLSRSNPQSYYHFMQENLFKHINIPPENINIPNGETTDPDTECNNYDQKLTLLGGTDLQILGIGINGHIGFNEPADHLPLATRKVDLTTDTITANSRFFANPESVPKQALTMGIGGIFAAKHILLLISGKNKSQITKKLFTDQVSTQIPATILNLHPNTTVILDQEAASLL